MFLKNEGERMQKKSRKKEKVTVGENGGREKTGK